MSECEREGCTSPWCSKWSPNFGYICDSCFDELLDHILTLGYIDEDVIFDFMNSPKGETIHDCSFAKAAMEDLNKEFETTW